MCRRSRHAVNSNGVAIRLLCGILSVGVCWGLSCTHLPGYNNKVCDKSAKRHHCHIEVGMSLTAAGAPGRQPRGRARGGERGQAQPGRLCAVEGRQAGRAHLGQPLGPRAPGVAHRVQRDDPRAHGPAHRHPRRRQARAALARHSRSFITPSVRLLCAPAKCLPWRRCRAAAETHP